ncbi:MAG TPA: M90 family metallopeptidase [Usitatibacter sp.]|nr:M90 family metallopeptidase [Usitatibacter sp.]
MALLLPSGLVALFIAWVVAGPWLLELRRDRWRARPFPREWRAILDRRVPYLRRLPERLRGELEGHVQVFVEEKQFIGCAGLEVTDEVRVVIAAQACLLVLGRRGEPFPKARDILVYPGPFAVERVEGAAIPGLMHENRTARSGESWTHGQVVISWDDALAGAADPDDGANVVIHEFAHQLDQWKGYANGAPWLGRRDRYPRWSAVMHREYARLRRQAADGEPALLQFYGTTSPAEFFAVASEAFFERARDMAALHPALYAELRSLYRVDPAAW